MAPLLLQKCPFGRGASGSHRLLFGLRITGDFLDKIRQHLLTAAQMTLVTRSQPWPFIPILKRSFHLRGSRYLECRHIASVFHFPCLVFVWTTDKQTKSLPTDQCPWKKKRKDQALSSTGKTIRPNITTAAICRALPSQLSLRLTLWRGIAVLFFQMKKVRLRELTWITRAHTPGSIRARHQIFMWLQKHTLHPRVIVTKATILKTAVLYWGPTMGKALHWLYRWYILIGSTLHSHPTWKKSSYFAGEETEAWRGKVACTWVPFEDVVKTRLDSLWYPDGF